MQFFRLADVPSQRGEQVFSYSRFRAVLGTALLAGSALAAFLFASSHDAWLGYYISGLLLLVLLIYHKLVTARFRSSNWLLRATTEGVLVKFRSYLNAHFDDRDLTVVFIPYSEIISATLVRDVRLLPDHSDRRKGGATRSARRLVEIEVDADCAALSKLLANERERIFGKSVFGAGKVSTRYQHLPVHLVAPKRLQIEWGVAPRPERLLEIFARHSIPRETAVTQTDFTNLDRLPKAQQEERLLQLVEGGNKLGAVTLARKLYAYDLVRATEFIEQLVQRQTVR
jgi:hypothetical protein